MTTSTVTGPGRVSQFIWGSRNQNTFAFTYPAALDNPKFWHQPRDGSERVMMANLAESWTQAYDFFASFSVRWIDYTRWSGHAGFQAFLDWCIAGNSFSFIPDAVNAPFFQLQGCWLMEPFDRVSPSLEVNGMQAIDIIFRHPTQDIGLAWRGLALEYLPGESATMPNVVVFSRAGTAARFTVDGKVAFAGNGVVRDNHYLGGIRYTLLEIASTNSCLQSQAWATTPWTASLLTPTNNSAVAPDDTVTATLLKPDGTSSAAHAVGQVVTITSGEFVAASMFLRSDGTYNGVRIQISDDTAAAATVVVGLSTGTILGTSAGGGATLSGSTIVALANGWYWVGMWGKLAALTTCHLYVYPFDTEAHANAQTAYAGDGTHGIYAWGGQLERWGTTVTLPPTSYIPTTVAPVARVVDNFRVALPASLPFQALWALVTSREAGDVSADSANNNSRGLFCIGTQMRLMWFKEGTAAFYRALFDNSLGTQVRPATNPATPAYGDKIEALLLLYQDGSVESRQSINGAAEAGQTRSAADQNAATLFGGNVLLLGSASPGSGNADGICLIRSIKIGYGVAVNTVALARTV